MMLLWGVLSYLLVGSALLALGALVPCLLLPLTSFGTTTAPR